MWNAVLTTPAKTIAFKVRKIWENVSILLQKIHQNVPLDSKNVISTTSPKNFPLKVRIKNKSVYIFFPINVSQNVLDNMNAVLTTPSIFCSHFQKQILSPKNFALNVCVGR